LIVFSSAGNLHIRHVTLKTDDVMMLKIQLCHNKNKHLTVCVQVEGQKGTIEFSPVLCK